MRPAAFLSDCHVEEHLEKDQYPDWRGPMSGLSNKGCFDRGATVEG